MAISSLNLILLGLFFYQIEALTTFTVKTKTTDDPEGNGYGTDADVWMKLEGEKGQSNWKKLDNPDKDDFRVDALDTFVLTVEPLGKLHTVRLKFENRGRDYWSAAWINIEGEGWTYTINLPGLLFRDKFAFTQHSHRKLNIRDINECQADRPPTCQTNSHCVNTQGSYRCDCNHGFIRNERTGICNRPCTALQFSCPNGRCISKRKQCDRNNDCGDMADEQNCLEPIGGTRQEAWSLVRPGSRRGRPVQREQTPPHAEDEQGGDEN